VETRWPRKQVTAASKEKVLDALGEAASKLRGELGESLATVQKFDVPLAEATTSSLEALKAYSLGRKAANEKGYAAALPYHQRAIELDPNFAMGYAVGNDYASLGRVGTGQRVHHQSIPVAGTCQRTGKAGDRRRLLSECNRRTG
jgi:tetratricopeptide (TPR) repeat protein